MTGQTGVEDIRGYSLVLPVQAEEGPLAALVDGGGRLRWAGPPPEATGALAVLTLERLGSKGPRRALPPLLTWEAGEQILALHALAGGAVAVETAMRVGVLTRNGQLAWERWLDPGVRSGEQRVRTAGDAVLVQDERHWEVLAAADGALRWRAHMDLEDVSSRYVLTRQENRLAAVLDLKDGRSVAEVALASPVKLRQGEFDVWQGFHGLWCGRAIGGYAIGCEPARSGVGLGSLWVMNQAGRLVAREGESERWALDNFGAGRLQAAGDLLLAAPEGGPWLLLDGQGRVQAVLLAWGPAVEADGLVWAVDGSTLHAWACGA